MIWSLVIYGICYIASLVLLWMYYKFVDTKKFENKWKKRLIKFLCLSVAIMPLVLLATFRFETGSDYYIYDRFYKLNEQHGVEYFLTSNGTGNISELLFWGTLETARVTFGSLQAFFFIASFLTLFIVILALDKYKNKINVCAGFAIFLMLLYPTSYNIVRQIIGVAIIAYGYHFIHERKILKYIICVLLASLFHGSAIFCLIFLALVDLKNKKAEKIRDFIIYTFVLLAPLLMPVVLDVFGDIPFFHKYFTVYDIEYASRWGLLLKKIPIIALAILYLPKFRSNIKWAKMYAQLLIMEVAACFVAFYSQWGFRIMYYMDFAQCIVVPLILKIENNKKRKIILIVAITLYYVGYYIYTFMIKGQEQVFPYKSIWSMS